MNFSLKAAAAALLLGASDILAQAPDSLMSSYSGEISWWAFLKMIGVLAIVIAAIWVTLRVLKGVTGINSGRLKQVNLLGGIPLGPRRSVQFIKVGKRVFMIGVTDHHVSRLGEFSDEDEISSAFNIIEGEGIPKPAFSVFLERFKPQAGTSKQTEDK